MGPRPSMLTRFGRPAELFTMGELVTVRPGVRVEETGEPGRWFAMTEPSPPELFRGPEIIPPLPTCGRELGVPMPAPPREMVPLGMFKPPPREILPPPREMVLLG